MKTINTATIDLDTLSAEEQYQLYNGADCCITTEVFKALEGKLEEAEPTYGIVRTLQAPAFVLMRRGVKIDFHERDKVIAKLQQEHARLQKIFSRLCEEGLDSPGVNYRSPIHLKHIFYSILGIEEIKIFDKGTKEYRASTGREALEKLAEKPLTKHLSQLILALRDIDKKLQVLLTGLENGRMHCSYQVAGTLTGRWASNKSAFGSGTNLQNISDEMRRIFIPDEGMKLCQMDQQQAESKLVAYLSLPWGDEYLKACQSGDLHTYVVRMIWPELFDRQNLPDKEIAKRKFYREYTYRDMAKRGGHGSNYGGTASVIAAHLKIPRQQAEEFQHKYFAQFPGIQRWHNHIRVLLAKGEPIVTPLGRRCHFVGRHWDNDTIKSAIAYGPQSSIADILNRGLYQVWRKFDKINGGPIELLLQVHDAIVFQYPEELENELLPAIASEIEYEVTINDKSCVIGVDAQVGWNWGKRLEFWDSTTNTVEVINPYGLADWNGADKRSRPPSPHFMDRVLYSSYQPTK